jgi:hypothetical protein
MYIFEGMDWRGICGLTIVLIPLIIVFFIASYIAIVGRDKHDNSD